MINFEYRLFNFPAERLFSPRRKIPGSDVSIPLRFIPFTESNLEDVCDNTDVIEFTNYFSADFGFENIPDFIEYAESNSLYKFIYDIPDDLQRKKLITKVIAALKYPFALQRMLQALVADDTIYTFHLPFLAESASDLESSFLLIEHRYYKQSLQTLRNVIEVTLAHGYFGLKGMDFHDVAQSIDFRMPFLRGGKNSLIPFLKEQQVIDDQLEVKIIALYKKLSNAVHSQISTLNSIQSKDTYEYFDEWYSSLTETGELNLKLILRMIEVGM